MSNPIVPVKTPLGQQELRQRTRRLGQRHRTVLLLVDGRRPLAEVLSMAHQAGAQTAHFEELLHLGMIELPALPELSSPPEQAAPSEQPAPSGLAERPQPSAPPDAEREEAVADAGRDEPAPEVAASAAPTPAHAGPAPPEAAAADAGAGAAASIAVSAASPAAFPAAALGAPVSPVPAASEHRLDEARRLLIDTLRHDTLLQRVFAPARVRAAQTQEELIGLVWEIERERAHVRRKRGQLLNLQRARDLLGMGNTVVAEDSLPWAPTEEED